MSALTQDRNTQSRTGNEIYIPVAAGAVIFAGSMVVANSDGHAAPGSTATGLTYLGMAEEYVSNATGSDGAVSIRVRRRNGHKWDNSGSDPVTQASLGKTCYIVDDHTVAATHATNTRSAAGTVIEIAADGVWVV